MNLRIDKIGNDDEGGKKLSHKDVFNEFKYNKKEAYIKAYDLYVDQIYRFIYFKVSQAEDARDLTSQVFLKTWNYLMQNELDDPETLRALFYKIARTTVIDHYRKNSQNIISIDDEESKITLIDESGDIGKKAEIESDLQNVFEKLKQLKDEYREVIIMKYLDELSIGEIAEALGKTKGSVRVLLHRALKAIKEVIDKT